MAMELYNTSAEKGLKPGSTGFCTVGMTAGMPEPMIRKLESLGGYRPAFDLGSPRVSLNPPAFVHSQVNIGGQIYSVLSHICFAGADHQGRFNKLAHHVVLDSEERGTAGPAWVMLQAGIMAKRWSSDARILPAGKAIPDGPNPLMKCDAWKKVAGDAGWAGMLAQAFVLDSSKSTYVIYPPGTDILSLVNESIALLPERLRWQVSFNTYFDTLPAGLSWTWRFCLAGSPSARAAPSHATSGVLIDLTASPGMAPNNIYVQMARTGQLAQESSAPGTPQASATIIAPKPRQSSAEETTAGFARKTIQGQTADAEPVAGATPQAQTAATVRQDYYEPPAPRRRTPIFWAAVLLWPILVLGGGGALIWAIQNQKPADDRPVDGTAVSELEEKLKKAKKLAASWQKQHADLGRRSEQDKKDAKNRYDTLRQRVTEAEEQARKAKNKTKELQSEIAELKKSNGTTARAPDKPRAGGDRNTTNGGNNSGNGNSAPVNQAAPDSIARSGVAKPIKLLNNSSRKTLGGEREICKAPEGSDNVKLVLPSALPEGFTTKKENRKFTVTYNMADDFGAKKKQLLLTLEIKDGKITATPKAIGISVDQRTHIKKLEELFLFSIMRVCASDQKELLTRRFSDVENAGLDLTKSMTKELRFPFELVNPVVRVTVDGTWKKEEGQGTTTPTIGTDSGAELSLLLAKAEKGTSFTARWGKGSSVSEIMEEMNKLLGEAKAAWAPIQNDQLTPPDSRKPLKGKPDTIVSQIHDTLLPAATTALGKQEFIRKHKAAMTARYQAKERFDDASARLRDKYKDGGKPSQKEKAGITALRQRLNKAKNKVNAYAKLYKSLADCQKKLNNISEKWRALTRRKEDVKKYSDLPVTIKSAVSGLILAEGTVKVGKKQ